MRVIKQTNVKEWIYKFTCSDCDSELEANGEDIAYQYYPGDPGDMRDPGEPNDPNKIKVEIND